MIQYALKCKNGHQFDSWFQSASAFEVLEKAGHLACAVCGDAGVGKAIMAPRVSTSDQTTEAAALSEPVSETGKVIAAMREHIEKNADYVGSRFAEEARAMYLGTAPERAVYGEANASDARALIEEGVPVLPLPFMPTRKAN